MRGRGALAIVLIAGALSLIPAGEAGAGVTCRGERATRVGNARNNFLIGTRNRDVFVGRGGNDAILGLRGDDLICGGPGSDVIDGMRGLDTVYGGRGTDACSGTSAQEHRLHHGCEAHIRPPRPGEDPPPETAQLPSTPNDLTATAKSPTIARGSPVHGASIPRCSEGRIDPVLVFAAGRYTDPSVVAYRPLFWFWTGRGETGWELTAPQDYFIDRIPLSGDFTIILLEPYNATRGYWWMGYEWWWWNGTEWTDYAFDPVLQYETRLDLPLAPDPLGEFCITLPVTIT